MNEWIFIHKNIHSFIDNTYIVDLNIKETCYTRCVKENIYLSIFDDDDDDIRQIIIIIMLLLLIITTTTRLKWKL